MPGRSQRLLLGIIFRNGRCQNNMMFHWSYIEAVYCFICGHRSVVVARYRDDLSCSSTLDPPRADLAENKYLYAI